ncbi:MAG: hypothetical protein ACJ8LV_07190, partial [Chthoniobacterales bacterium]
MAGIVDPGHNLYSRSDRCAWALSAQADRFLVPSASLKSCCPKKSHQENLNSSASPRRTKTWRVLAAVSALPSRNTFVQLPNQKARLKCNDIKSKTTKGKKSMKHTRILPLTLRSAMQAGLFLIALVTGLGLMPGWQSTSAAQGCQQGG